ncbi:hypothetical protein CHS0354_022842 [Potamilus streckersoni]|uniref:C-type lectin domain-containing protein n=1 Tax=Potamilus streckersoni TaxID=2493646 RepID=A0AAE0S1Y2_9BIVA|nr:hypothetical protein CHS0354_022842 [Potamilus streckersoni]
MFATPLIIIALFHVGIGITDTDDMYRCPSEIRGNWYTRTYGDMCYLFINSERTWVNAQNDCSRRGGNLITIQTAGIQTFVERNLQALNWKRNGLWIGANDRHREWHWVWVTGEAVASGYRKWAPDQPSCYIFTPCHEDCANLRLSDGYKWHDYPCDTPGLYEYSYICQFRMMPKTTTAATTTTSTTTTTSKRILPMQPLSPLLRITSTMATTPATKALKTSSSVEPFSTMLLGENDTKTGPSSPWSVELGSVLDVDKNFTGQVQDTVDVKVEHQHLAAVDAGVQTEGLIGIIVTFVLVFIAGLIIGLLICRRRHRKRYTEDYSVAFNNITYAVQPKQQSNRIKNTNTRQLLNTADATDESDVDETVHYAEIDDIKPSCSVELPKEKEGACVCDNGRKMDESPYEEIHADFKISREDNSDDSAHVGANGLSPFTPEFLKKDPTVALTYSNNLYSRMA